MKTKGISATFLGLVIALGLSLGCLSSSLAQDEGAGIEQQMTPSEFKAAGLEKLTPAELAKLNAWLKGYREEAVKVAEKKAAKRTAKLEKKRSDLFRHWILGLGSGDLLVHSAGAQAQHFDLPNVLFIGRKVQMVEDMLREKAVVKGR